MSQLKPVNCKTITKYTTTLLYIFSRRARTANNGRTLKLMFDCDNQEASNEAHGPLTLYSDVGMQHERLDYDLAELHFHWSEQDENGSEHALKGKKFPAEAHLKFKHRSHADVAFHVAKLTEGAVHAVGVPLTSGDSDIKFPTLGLEKRMRKVRNFRSSFRMNLKVKPLRKFLDKVLENVYRYVGSLTTPPCTLGLPWLVSAEPAKVKSSFLDELRKLKDETDNKIKRNFRDLQEHSDELKLCLYDG